MEGSFTASARQHEAARDRPAARRRGSSKSEVWGLGGGDYRTMMPKLASSALAAAFSAA